jgi:hypothetical protein
VRRSYLMPTTASPPKAILSAGLFSAYVLPDVLARPSGVAAAQPAPAEQQAALISKCRSGLSVQVRPGGSRSQPFRDIAWRPSQPSRLCAGWNSYARSRSLHRTESPRFGWFRIYSRFSRLWWFPESAAVSNSSGTCGRARSGSASARRIRILSSPNASKRVRARFAGHEEVRKAWVNCLVDSTAAPTPDSRQFASGPRRPPSKPARKAIPCPFTGLT